MLTHSSRMTAFAFALDLAGGRMGQILGEGCWRPPSGRRPCSLLGSFYLSDVILALGAVWQRPSRLLGNSQLIL